MRVYIKNKNHYYYLEDILNEIATVHSLPGVEQSATVTTCCPLRTLPVGRAFRIVSVNASPRLARQLVLLGLCEDTTGRLLERRCSGGMLIEHLGRRLNLTAPQAACLGVAPSVDRETG